jgi:hypothetical protein
MKVSKQQFVERLEGKTLAPAHVYNAIQEAGFVLLDKQELREWKQHLPPKSKGAIEVIKEILEE